MAQVLDLDALLLLTRRLLHLAGVVVGAAVGGAHWVEADVRAVDVAHAPGRRREKKKNPIRGARPLIYQLCRDEKKINGIWNISGNKSVFIPPGERAAAGRRRSEVTQGLEPETHCGGRKINTWNK